MRNLMPSVIALTLVLLSVTANAAPSKGSMVPTDELPPSESTHEALPPAPSPLTDHDASIRQQAGVGSPTSYARVGVLELGGGFSLLGSGDGTTLAFTPSIGWFFANNFELSGIIQLSHNRVKKESSTYFTALAEPSAHIPVYDGIFLFGGLGLGATYDAAHSSTGFALAPRAGANFLVGRSGILTPSASWNWSSNQTVQAADGSNMVAVNSTYGVNVAYTVMW